MTSVIALAAVGLFVAGMITGITALVSVAIRREDKSLTLTSAATGPVTRAGRLMTGAHVRAPRQWHTHTAGGDPDAR